MSAANVNNEYLEFLKNYKDNFSSLFCIELVAHVYQEFYLIGEFNNSQMKQTSTFYGYNRTVR